MPSFSSAHLLFAPRSSGTPPGRHVTVAEHVLQFRAGEKGFLGRRQDHALDGSLLAPNFTLQALHRLRERRLPLLGHGIDRGARGIEGDGDYVFRILFKADG
jgi:hypothetical protein